MSNAQMPAPAQQPPGSHVPALASDGAAASIRPPVEAARAFDGVAPLDAEKLLVYRLALDLQALCSTLVPPQQRVLQDQLERASLSVVLNIAEGAGRHSRKEKRRFYAIARGSSTETAAIIDVLRLRRLAPEGACSAARSLAVRVVQLLTKLGAALG